MQYTIYIPTIGRIGQQRTWDCLSDRLRERTWLVTSPEERDALETCHPEANIMACPAKGIGPTRQWLLERCPTDICYMMDDDFRFRRRADPEDMSITKMVTATKEETEEAIMDLFTLVSTDGSCPMAGIAHSFGNNRATERVSFCKRLYSNYALWLPTIRKEGLRFDEIPLMEDFCLTLHLLTRGYRNAIINYHCWDQLASGHTGGCSTYRTAELQKHAAETLARLFPKFVKVVEKKTNTGWFGGVRHDVFIQWKKAYEFGLQCRELGVI